MKSRASFTLIEVMLAVGIFSIAVVGFSRALNDVLAIQSEILRNGQKRQALDSLAAQYLAVSNALVPADWKEREEFSAPPVWSIREKTIQAEPIVIAGTNQSARQVVGWFQVYLECLGRDGEPNDAVSLLLSPQR